MHKYKSKSKWYLAIDFEKAAVIDAAKNISGRRTLK